MRYPASEKLEIINLVERSSRPGKWTLDKLGVSQWIFYRWYDRYLEHGKAGLIARAPMPSIVWNKVPDEMRSELLRTALDLPDLSPRELAVHFTDTKGYFLLGDLERQIESFVEHCNHSRYHESLNNLKPADLYFGRGQLILEQRERIKQKTIEQRRLQYRKAVA